MLVYNCRPSDAVSIKTDNNDIRVTVDTIINQNTSKQVQLRVKSNKVENKYLLKPNDSFSCDIGTGYLEIKLGHTTPSKTALYIGPLENARFKFIKGGV